MSSGIPEEDWKTILKYIKGNKCTPFLGAGASSESIDSAAKIAQNWAKDEGYPLYDEWDLMSVAQYIACKRHPNLPKEMMAEICKEAKDPNFFGDDQIHGVLADLPLSIYITTNYDDFMYKALDKKEKKPKRELCRWNPHVNRWESPFKGNYQPSHHEPLVYHLHGYWELTESMVLTDKDYIDFLIWLKKDTYSAHNKKAMEYLIPSQIRTAMTSSMLFIGYSFRDWTFKMLFLSIIEFFKNNSNLHLAVQLDPKDAKNLESAKEYLKKYHKEVHEITLTIFWGDVKSFASELKNQWLEYNKGEH